MFSWRREKQARYERPSPLTTTHVFDKFVRDEDGWRTVRIYADKLQAPYGLYWHQAFAGPDTVTGLIDIEGTVIWSFDCIELAQLRKVCGFPEEQPVTAFVSQDTDDPVQAGRRTAVLASGDQPGHVDHARTLVTVWHQSGVDLDMPLRIVAQHHTTETAVDEQILFDNGTLRDFGRAFRLETSDY